jgi:hypothetical protein
MIKMKNNNKVQKTTNVGNEVLTDVSKRFNTIDDANLFLNENKVPTMDDVLAAHTLRGKIQA